MAARIVSVDGAGSISGEDHVMGRDPDSLDDEGTWQQPLRGPGAGRPQDQFTARELPLEDDESAPAPESTDPARTSPYGDVSRVQEVPSGADTSEHDAHSTRLQPPDTSREWDALPPPVLEVGQVVFNKYRLLQKIGEGGMGEVWRVWHIHLESERALKLIKAELAQNEKGWRRFQREARLMAKINHPNAVAVFDFRRTQSVGYIEMEFIRGRSLSDVLKDGHKERMPLDWTTQILEQLCAVLQEAHGHLDETSGQPRPIIHRDLKPSNLMLVDRKDETGPPRLKVLDFGIAKIAEDEGSPELTGAGDLVGTPAYMSPEQIRGGFEKDRDTREIDGRSDLYSTGVVLYHLLTGTLPFRGNKMTVLAAHLNNPPLPMKEANPRADIPPEVERVVLRCLEKNPDRRPRTAHELFEQFRRAADTSAAAPRRNVVGATRSRRTAAAAAVVLVAVLGFGAAMLARVGGKASDNLIGSGGGSSSTESTKGKPKPPTPPPSPPLLWEPKGYAAVDASDIVPNHAGFTVRLRRLDDSVTFVFVRDRVYIPEGYEPASLDDLLGDPGWPRVIVRKRDKVRFVRIPGAVYRRGDPKPGAPDLDYQDKPIAPHYVRVGGFYIQEAEVTCGEIESYAKDHPEDPEVQKWKKRLAGFRADHPDASTYPADSVDYTLARKYARSVGGLLPTEAQWEWAAKSCNEGYWFAWGVDFAPQNAPAWANLVDPNGATFGQAPVKQYKKDQTEQHVFDMVGNLRELCADTYVPYTELKLAGNAPKNPLIDERGPVDAASPDAKIVVRGGSFMRREAEATAFYRWLEPPKEVPPDVGFRVVVECPEEADQSP